MDLSTLWQHWPLPGPWQMRLLTRGNNLVYLVETPAAGPYILRVSQNHHDPKRLRYELAIVAGLQRAGLPFVVPAPIATSAGEDWLALQDGQEAALATLWPFVSGAEAERDNVEQAAAAGYALAQLDAALGTLEPPAGPDVVVPPPMGDLPGCFPLIPDPLRVPERLPLDAPGQARLRAVFQQVIESIPRLYADLPQQVIHADYDPDNILMEGHRVTGVLDFEFSGVDLRVTDLTNALMWWPLDLLGTGREWALIEALGDNYARRLPLLPREVEAIPAIIRLRSVVSLLHRLERHWQGLSSEQAVLKRVDFLFEREDWLHTNQAVLLQRARRWQQPG